MFLKEYICGLFDYFSYAFPKGSYIFEYNKRKYTIDIDEVVLLDKQVFSINTNLVKLYTDFEHSSIEFIDKYPVQEHLLIKKNIFEKKIKRKKNDKELISIISELVKEYYIVIMKLDHEYDGIDPLQYIISVRDKQGIENLKKDYFSIVRKINNYVRVINSPYVNMLEINQIHSDDMFSFFTNSKGEMVTEVLAHRYDCWLPNNKMLTKEFNKIFGKKIEIPIEDVFIATAKIHLGSV